jgi:hypothetical protein
MVRHQKSKNYDLGHTNVTMSWEENMITLTVNNPDAIPGIVAILDTTFKKLSMDR